MSGNKRIKIGIIASLTGRNSKAGKGMLDSASYMIEKKCGKLEKKGISIELVVKDDSSDSSSSVSKAKELVEEDCLAIFGPTDSHTFRKILNSGVCENIPVFSTIASATYLSKLEVENFFRFTTPDFIRAEILVRSVRRLYPNSLVHVGALEGAELSYGQQLKKDVINALEKYNIKWVSFDYDGDGDGGNFKEQSNDEPIIACGPSASIVSLALKVREKYKRSQFFAFGSNTNLLHDSLIHTIVVCDLDREDTNPIARDEIDHFSAQYSENSDPDLSTMNAISTLCNVLAENSKTIASSELPSARFNLLNILKTGAHKALIGQVSFTESGEMAGYENILLMRVAKKKGKYMFSPLDREEKALLQDKRWWKDKAKKVLTIVGSIASIMALMWVIYEKLIE